MNNLMPARDSEEGIFNLPEGRQARAVERQLELNWLRFRAGEPPGDMRPAILASWQRARDAGIAADEFHYVSAAPAELENILAAHAELIEVAREVMENLLAYNPDGHINLTDASGVTLSYCGQQLTPVGSILSEAVQGTNCTGRCLQEKKLVYVLSGENWKMALRQRNLPCAAAPVRNSEGEMIGVLTLTTRADNFNTHTLGTVQAAAEAIGQQLTLRRLLAEQTSILETLNEGVIVFDRHGVIKTVNRYARQIFRNIPLQSVAIDPALNSQSGSLLTHGFCNDREMTFSPTPEQRLSCLVSLMPAPNGGRVLSLRENQRIRAITRRVIGVSASYTFEMIRGHSQAIKEAIYQARTSARSDSTVLLTGESGTGKELFAQAIHNASQRASEPFVALNCGALPRDLVQSELFGYADGAFTGSRRGGSAGKFELADGGTLFLDEIGEMPLEAQTSLLRVLQENEVVRIGAAHPLPVNVRIIAATNCDLVQAVENGAFRRDLYYRLNVMSIAVPALRERPQDIAELIASFSEKQCAALQRLPPQLSAEASACLEAWHWPGNVRELENLVERLINLCEGMTITLADLPPEMAPKRPPVSAPDASARLEDAERQHIIAVIREHAGNLRQSAATLGISRTALYNKLKLWAIDPAQLRQ